MELFGRDLDDRLIGLPLLVVVAIAGIFIVKLFDQVRSSFVFIVLYSLFTLLGLMVFFRSSRDDESDPGTIGPTPYVRKLLSIAFFSAFSLAIVALKIGSPGAVRPNSYYAFGSLAIGLVAARALVTTGERRDIGWVFCQILLLGLLVRFSFVYLNPYPYVSDHQFHWQLIQQTVSQSRFAQPAGQSYGPYRFYPIFHILNSTVFQIGQINLQQTWVFPVVSNLTIVGTLPITYLIGRELAEPRVGLLATVLLLPSLYFLGPSYSPTYFGTIFLFSAFLILILLLELSTQVLQFWVMFWFLSLATLLTHPVNFIVLILLVGGIQIALSITSMDISWDWGLLSSRSNMAPLLSTTFLFLAYVLYLHTNLFVRIVDATIGIDQSVQAQRLGLTVNAADISVLSKYTLELVINYLGMSSYMLAVVPGVLYSVRTRHKRLNSIAIGFLLIHLFIVGIVFGGRGGELSITRLLLYNSVLLALMGAIGLWYVVRSRTPLSIAAIAVTGLFVLSLFSMTSYVAGNFNGSNVDEIEHFQLTMKPSSLAAGEFIDRVPAGSEISGDPFTLAHIASRDPVRGIKTYSGPTRPFFVPGWENSTYHVVNEPTLQKYESKTSPSYTTLDNVFDAEASRIYHNEGFLIYYAKNGGT